MLKDKLSLKGFNLVKELDNKTAEVISGGENWAASCNNLAFNFNRDSETYRVYFKTTGGNFQVAKGRITFDNGSAIKGPIIGNSPDYTELGLNRSRGLVYVTEYHDPITREYKRGGEFCTTEIERLS